MTASVINGTASVFGTSSVDPKTVNTKITLKKKSGPGELLGEVEKTVYLGECSFDSIQFDQPGEYIIEAIPSDDTIEKTEFKISVLGDMKPESTEKPTGPSASETGTRPIIAQIDKPSIRLKAIEYDLPTNPDYESVNIATTIGKTPFFWFNGYQIEERNISTLSLYHDGMTPCSSVTFIDSKNLMNRNAFPLDDTTFEIFLNSNSENLKSIHLKFKLSNFKENRDKSYTITGTIDLKDYYKINFSSYTGTSFDVLRKISKELELGFNSNIINTNDSMKWTNVGKNYRELMSGIMKHSYIDDKSFMLGYIDFYYCFNFVDLEKEWLRDINSDIGIDSTGLSSLGTEKEEEKIKRLVLSNDKSDQGSINYISEYSIKNNSTAKSIEKGHYTVTKYYDTSSKSFLVFNVDSQTSTDDSKVILKGKPTDGKEINENYRTSFGGRFDLLNVHKNYLYAKTQNEINLQNLTKVSCELTINALNFNLYMYQKIKIIFSNPAPTAADDSLTQERLTGEWMIIDIKYTWVKNIITQKIIAVKKELEKLPEERDQITAVEPETKGENKNETVQETPPNSIYEPGEIYKLKDKDGKEYTITIEKLLENGNEIQGYLVETPVVNNVAITQSTNINNNITATNSVATNSVATNTESTSTSNTTNDSNTTNSSNSSKTESTKSSVLTVEQQMDLILKRNNLAIESKDSSGSRTITVYYDNQKSYIIFYNNGRFANYNINSSGFISKGNYYEAGRKFIVSDGKNKGKTLETNNFWDTLKLLKN